jgi:hypothetical protein
MRLGKAFAEEEVSEALVVVVPVLGIEALPALGIGRVGVEEPLGRGGTLGMLRV